MAQALLLEGKPVAEKVMEELKASIDALLPRMGRPPGLAVVLVGEDPASQVYVRIKGRSAKKLGITTFDHHLPEDTSQQDIVSLIEDLNRDEKVDGMLVQLPLPGGLNEEEVLRRVSPQKDADVFHPENFGKLALKQGTLKPCTPAGVLEILKFYDIGLEGKKTAIIGRSKIVGLPLAILMMHENATITVCHSRTRDIPAITREADIVVAAMGRPKFLTADMVREGAVVVDVGINRVDRELVGDCDFEPLLEKVSAITPVPGGVGPMTVAMLMMNTTQAYSLKSQEAGASS